MPNEFEDQYGDDPEVSRLLREQLPRHAPPAHLRATITRALEPRRRARSMAWLSPALSALATAMIMLMWLAPSLPTTTADPIHQLLQAVITEHARSLVWGASQPDVVPTALPWAMEESGVAMNWVFAGDDQLQLVNAHPTYVEGHRAIALIYQDSHGHTVTYVMLPGATMTIPERGRVQIDRWRPLVQRDSGFSFIVWKQQGLVCALVSDLVSESDLNRFKQYFVKVRSSTEPFAPF